MPKPSSLNPSQRRAAEHALAELGKLFPGLGPKQLVAGPLAELAYGPLPSYSELSMHNVTDVDTSTDGSFVVCYAMEPHTGETLAVIIERGEKGPNGESRYGVTGGYMNIHSVMPDERSARPFVPGEQPAKGAKRELGEELLDDQGRPVLDLDPRRFCLIASGIDYSGAAKGHLPSHYTGYAVELTTDELRNVKRHVFRLKTDTAYRDAVREKSHHEVMNALLLPLRDVAAWDNEKFTHPHELDAVRELHSLLRQGPDLENSPSLKGRALWRAASPAAGSY